MANEALEQHVQQRLCRGGLQLVPVSSGGDVPSRHVAGTTRPCRSARLEAEGSSGAELPVPARGMSLPLAGRHLADRMDFAAAGAGCSVGSVLFYALGLSLLVIGAHAALRVPDDLFLDEAPEVGGAGGSVGTVEWQCTGPCGCVGEYWGRPVGG